MRGQHDFLPKQKWKTKKITKQNNPGTNVKVGSFITTEANLASKLVTIHPLPRPKVKGLCKYTANEMAA